MHFKSWTKTLHHSLVPSLFKRKLLFISFLVTVYGKGTSIIIDSRMKKNELITVVLHDLSVMYKN